MEKRGDAKSNFRCLVTADNGVIKHKVLLQSRVEDMLKDNPVTGGHFGRDKTLANLHRNFIAGG